MKGKLIDWKYFKSYKLKPLVVMACLSTLIYIGIQLPFFLTISMFTIFTSIEWILVKRFSSRLFSLDGKFIVINQLNILQRRIEIPFSDIKVLRINKRIPSSTIYNIEFVLDSGRDRFIWFQKITQEDIERIRKTISESISVEVLS